MEKNKKDVTSKHMTRCKHCGGPMRDYRYSVSCLMCGRGLEHDCERCRYAEEKYLERKVA